VDGPGGIRCPAARDVTRGKEVVFTCQAGRRAMFIVAQLAGALVATALFAWLTPALPAVAERVVVPHPREAAQRTAGELS
jgi:glycerol uptake facilitator-like aquaporin